MGIASFFIVRASKGCSSKWHSHSFWEIVYNESAGGCIEFGDKKEKYKRGSVMVLRPNVPHLQICGGEGAHWCLGLSGYETEGFKEVIFKDKGRILSLLKNMARELKVKRVFYRAFMEADAAKIALILKRLTSGKQAVPEEDERIRKIKRTLDEKFDKNIDFGTLIGNVFLSKEYVRQVFKKEYGTTPLKYLIQKRIEKAKILLLENKLTIKEIAAICGFENEYYFSRLFKKVVSVSPKAYRNTSQ